MPTSRLLTAHAVNGTNEALQIAVLDQPGQGGACHRYDITGFDTSRNPAADVDGYVSSFSRLPVVFQNGPIKEYGVNGVTQEVLLAILIDRLEGFQSGPYACADNAEALTHLRGALECLQRRTKARLARGVEGTHTV